MPRKICRRVLDVGELGGGPAAANGFDEEDAGAEAAGEKIDGSDFVGKSSSLREGDFEVVGDAAAIARFGKRERVLGGGDSAALSLCFLLQNAQGGKIVLHFLERAEDRLAVVIYGLIVGGSGLFSGAASQTAVEQEFGSLAGKRPKAGRPLQKRAGGGAFESAATG